MYPQSEQCGDTMDDDNGKRTFADNKNKNNSNNQPSVDDGSVSSQAGNAGDDVIIGAGPGGVTADPTVVTASPVPSEIEQPITLKTTTDCPRRASGQVCICVACEAARIRLLNRRQGKGNKRKNPAAALSVVDSSSSSPSNQSGVLSTTDHDNDNNNININQQASKRRMTVATAGAANQEDDDENMSSSHSNVTQLVCGSASASNNNSNSFSTMTEGERIAKMSAACRTILECIGEDPSREGLVKTPQRWAKALMYMCHGYQLTPAQVTNNAVFSENHDEMVVVRDIDIHSLCEHHMVPFSGRVHIGYIPNGQIVGLSKLARIAECFARRLQVQERLTRQIADAVVETVQPLGVAVVVECTHFCMVMRGVQKTAAVTTTSSVRGCFESNPKTRAEFFSILHGKPKFC